MRFLADENCDRAILRRLIDAGHDVLSIAEEEPGATDHVVFARAVAEGRILISQDQDFSRILRNAPRAPLAIIMMRWGRFPRLERAVRLAAVVEQIGAGLLGHIAVVEPGHVRLRALR